MQCTDDLWDVRSGSRRRGRNGIGGVGGLGVGMAIAQESMTDVSVQVMEVAAGVVTRY